MKTALIVIDAQQSFVERPYFSPQGLSTYLDAQNRAIQGAAAAGMPIVRVFHEEPGDASQPFSPMSGFVRPIDGLADFTAALTVRKSRHSALVGTGLDVWLVQQGIGRLIITGIRTEQCCETTARHASDLGWQVLYTPEATMTWDIPLPTGAVLAAQDIRERTAAVLRGRFADVLSVEQALDRAHLH